MRVVSKDRIRFVVPDDDGTPLELEIRVRPDRFGGLNIEELREKLLDAAAPSPPCRCTEFQLALKCLSPSNCRA